MFNIAITISDLTSSGLYLALNKHNIASAVLDIIKENIPTVSLIVCPFLFTSVRKKWFLFLDNRQNLSDLVMFFSCVIFPITYSLL